MTAKSRATVGTLWAFAQQFSSQIIGFGLSIVLARLLLPEEFGLIGMIMVFMSISRVLVEAGLGQSLIRTKEPSQIEYSTVFFFNLLGSLIIYGAVFWSAPFIASFYSQEILSNIIRVYALVIIINAFGSIQTTRLTKSLDFKTQMQVALPSLIVSGVLGVFLAYAGWGVWSLVVTAVTQSLLNTIQLWFWTGWRPSMNFDMQAFKHHFNYGYKLTLSGLLDTVFSNAYPILIGKFFLPAQVGFFTRANSTKQLPVKNISSVLNKVTFPLFAEMQDDNKRLKAAYKKIMQLVTFIIAPTMLVLAVLAEPLFRFLFGANWLPAAPYFQILCWNGIIYPIQVYNLNILKVKGRSDLFLALEIAKKSILVVIILISFPYGIEGLLYGSVVSAFLAFFINSYFSGKFIDYSAWQQIRDLLPYLLTAIVAAVIVAFFDSIILDYVNLDFFRLMIGGIIGATSYLILTHILSISQVKNILSLIRQK